jgi:hypothetical protein
MNGLDGPAYLLEVLIRVQGNPALRFICFVELLEFNCCMTILWVIILSAFAAISFAECTKIH